MLKIRVAVQRVLMMVALVLAGLPLASAQGVTIRSGHAGHWYAADRSGEGWVLELRDAGGAWLYWFTYDGQGRQRWMTAAGEIVDDGHGGQRIDFAQLVVTRGARFGAAFDPDDVVREAVGSASFRFDSCDSGQFSYNAYGQNQTFAVQRLARVMGTRCETPHGVTGREVADHAGQSGSWYDPTHNGEGYALHWETPNQAIVTWYSYDTQGNQYWMLGTGQLDGEGRIHFPDVHATRGARFGTAFDPDDVERFAWGELTFELACDGGNASYQSVLPAFGNGEFDLARLTSLHEVACPWQRPKLTDLYDIELTELPVAIEGYPADRVLAFVARIEHQGVIWALASVDEVRRVVRLMPGAESWEVVGDLETVNILLMGLVDDSDFVAIGRLSQADVFRPMRWNGSTWVATVTDPDAVIFTGLSESSERLMGLTTDRSGWTWHADTGLTVLPPVDDHPLSYYHMVPVLANESGSLVVGSFGSRARPILGRPYNQHAFVWRDGGEAEPLQDAAGRVLSEPSACARDCALVFGVWSVVPDPSRPLTPLDIYPALWLWQPDSGQVRYLLDGEPDWPRYIHAISGASRDGNLVTGAYGEFVWFSSAPAAMKSVADESFGLDGFVWTELTGMMSMRGLMGELNHPAAQWQYLDVAGISADGTHLLLTNGRGIGSTTERRLMSMKLVPRSSSAVNDGRP